MIIIVTLKAIKYWHIVSKKKQNNTSVSNAPWKDSDLLIIPE